ncbi:MAG: V-type ATP synthase subunit I [Halobacteriaceae archaeon]
MLRPEQMSRVSVTGSKAVMADVVEAVHDLNLVHLVDYDERWEGFETGTPMMGADEASEKLVTVRSLESILEVDAADVGPATVDEATLDDRLEEVRAEVNDLDDRRDAVESDLDAVEDRIDNLEPFVDLGIELDLLSGYDSLQVAVGEADPGAVRDALARADGIRAFETFSTGDVVAAFVSPSESAETPLDDALVGVEFTRYEIPDAEGAPEEHVEELEHERRQLESRLDSLEGELEDLRLEHGGFLVAAERHLSVAVEQAEAPLQFATTKRAFVAEGWVPTQRFADLREAVQDAVGDRVVVEETERADYTPSHGHETEAVADGGHEALEDEGPPVVQRHPGAIRPFELLVETINRPRYFELDPTVVLFLTFPVFYGFMIGDLGYGLLYTGIGYWLYSSFDSDAFRSLGGVAVWAGAFTMLFGVLYGEIFGFHLVTQYLWEGALGMSGPPIEKGLHALEFAKLWLTLSVVVGVVHLFVGWGFGFVNDSKAHGLREAVLEDASWILLMVGIWTWVFSRHAASAKPDFIVGSEAILNGHPVALGFAGFPAAVGLAGLVVALVGFVLVVAGEGAVGFLESPNALVNVISYTRIAAVLLAKAGMAFVVNLLAFGVYETHHGEEAIVHFILPGTHVPAEATVTPFAGGGLLYQGPLGILGGLLVLVVGHALVLALGVTSAGLQAVRLEYVEFFNKFYEGGGAKYEPFGYDESVPTED